MEKINYNKYEHFFQSLIEKNILTIKIFFIAFTTNVLIYGQKLFFNNLATDDYSRFFAAGSEQASWLGRWMAGILNHNIFSGNMFVLPYLHGLLGVFFFTLAGIITANILQQKKPFNVFIITLLISTTPFVAHNLLFGTNITTWMTTFLGVFALYLVYQPKYLTKAIGFILLTISIGTYQTIIQVALAIIIIKMIIEIVDAKDNEEVKKIIFTTASYVVFVILAFAASSVINALYIEYNNLTVRARLKNAESAFHISIILDRLYGMYHSSIGFHFFKKQYYILYLLMGILSFLSISVLLLKQIRKNSSKVLTFIFISCIYISIPIIIFLPQITGNGIPIRAHYAIGWFLAGFFILSHLSKSNLITFLSRVLSIIIIVVNIYYINIFYYAANRQTESDLSRINQIVNRIRLDPNYITEPLQLKIVGTKMFSVEGQYSYQQALATNWSHYNAFKHFTDLNFTKMKNKEYQEIINYLSEENIKVRDYPAKNSIIVHDGKAILVLNSRKINNDIKLAQLPQRTPDLISDFNLYITNKNLYYVKQPCSKEDIKHRFFLHVYSKDKKNLPAIQQKRGWLDMDFNFNSAGIIKDNRCIAFIALPEYDISKVRTGQFENDKIDWDVTYSVESNNSN